MSILKIAKLGHPVLLQKSTKVDKISDPGIKNLIHNMTETMIDADGIGLAAPQVHVNKQIIVFRTLEENQENSENTIKVTALINPKITNISDEFASILFKLLQSNFSIMS